jgi:molecular chaperone GrpE
VFANHGVEPLNPIDQDFDPHTMEAMFYSPDPDRKPNTVSLVHLQGYLLKGRVVRAAQVGVVSE